MTSTELDIELPGRQEDQNEDVLAEPSVRTVKVEESFEPRLWPIVAKGGRGRGNSKLVGVAKGRRERTEGEFGAGCSERPGSSSLEGGRRPRRAAAFGGRVEREGWRCGGGAKTEELEHGDAKASEPEGSSAGNW